MTIYIHDVAWTDSEAVPVQVAPNWDMRRLHQEVVVRGINTRPPTRSVAIHTCIRQATRPLDLSPT